MKSCKPLYEIYNSIYKDKLKGFYDKDYIYNNFTDISLAILIGDDGYKTGIKWSFCSKNVVKRPKNRGSGFASFLSK